MKSKEVCPNGCDLQGDPIPQEYIDKGYYAEGTTHYSRMIGVDGGWSGIYDGVIYWLCPDCGVRWHRFPEGTGDKSIERIRFSVEAMWRKQDEQKV